MRLDAVIILMEKISFEVICHMIYNYLVIHFAFFTSAHMKFHSYHQENLLYIVLLEFARFSCQYLALLALRSHT